MAGKLQKVRAGVVYDIFLWIFTVVVDLFFRTIHPRSSWRIPRKGPVIFVAAPHANQFVDPLILMRTVRQDAHRQIAFLIAAKSMQRKFVGFAASLVGSVPVGRALDMKKPTEGKIYLPDPEGDPTLIKGTGVNFKEAKFEAGGLLVLPTIDNAAANAEIKEAVSATEIRLKKPFKGDVAIKQLTQEGGTKFSVAPHLDQSAVYDAVFKRIREGGCIGIFPEGGSHDRTELLPLKAGLAIMALGALAEDPDCGVTIVPVGMNYFHAHKFRSRAVIEFGSPIEIDPKLVEQYRNGDRRGAIGTVLEIVYDKLAAVTTLAPDYETLMLIQAVRRLYNPKGKPMPLPMVVELNRRLIKGYTAYKDDPRIVSLKKNVLDYNSQLFRLGIRDHQISYAKFTWYEVFGKIIYRIGKLALLSIAVLPGTVLFAPVFIAGKVISRIKMKEALAASTVKVKARDVMATWKILVSLALAPTLDVFYTIVITSWTKANRVRGLVPEWIPLWAVALTVFIGFPMICFAALRFGEIGMDIFKSLRPLMLSINPTSSNTLTKLRARRQWLQDEINNIINELGPELFPDFEKDRLVHDTDRPTTPTSVAHADGSESPRAHFTRAQTSGSAQLPRNESFNNIGSVGIFASRPSTPNRSRSRHSSHDFGNKLHGLSPMTSSKPNMDEVSKNLHAAMRERGRRRRSEDGDGWVLDPSEDGTATGSEYDGEEPKKDI